MKTVEIQPKVTASAQLAPNSAVATANANIALIKYWGKRDEKLILPYTSSLSLTLSDLYTQTAVNFSDDFSEDSVTLDGENLLPGSTTFCRVISMLDLVREKAGISTKARVVSRNHVPTAAGLASSASGFAALCAAAAFAAGLKLTPRELSRLARRGSGSACRSIFGGLVIWHAGEDDETSYAEPVAEAASPASAPKNLNLAMIVVTLDDHKKAISSREAMRRTVETSPAYMPWVEQSKLDLSDALEAIRAADIEKLGEVVERNALGMHETMHKAAPPVNYFTDKTYAVLRAVRAMRECGWPVWATMDAGPNVKVLTDGDLAERAAEELRGRVEYALIQGDYADGDVARGANGAGTPLFSIARAGDGVSVSVSLEQAAKL
ncbi:diphosphomevalonate decarboxylase [Bifidobacteriaceae bacterium NR002]|nr:diphosphomevalonate decarboxylase [Bifidobacteriaceae bacterium NR002]MDZ7549968.1 diphosphomevalonate decarboxylase [Bifidobacteriaceae bacterium NR047]